MFHAIKGRLVRLAQRISDRRALPFEYAAWHGREVHRTGRGTYGSATRGSPRSPPREPHHLARAPGRRPHWPTASALLALTLFATISGRVRNARQDQLA
jgi:hypothetical protein